MCDQEQIDLRFNHLDSTSLTVSGQYEADETEPATITLRRGYSKDHRPDLKQAVLEMMVSQDGGVPLMCQAWDSSRFYRLTPLTVAQAELLAALRTIFPAEATLLGLPAATAAAPTSAVSIGESCSPEGAPIKPARSIREGESASLSPGSGVPCRRPRGKIPEYPGLSGVIVDSSGIPAHSRCLFVLLFGF